MSFIGVFDSGLGGLSILKALHTQFPYENFVYVADTKNVPYGEKNSIELKNIFYKNINYFKNSKCIVVACNTLSGLLPTLSLPTTPVVFGMVDALVQTSLQNYKDTNYFGVLATSFTIKNNTYGKAFYKANNNAIVYQVAAPLLVPAIENDDPNILNIMDLYITQLPKKTTHLILGCTHYNLLSEKLQYQYRHLTIISPYEGILKQLTPLITQKKTNEIKPIVFLTTKYTKNLQKISEKIMQQKVDWTEIDL